MEAQTTAEFAKVALDLMKLIMKEDGLRKTPSPEQVEASMLKLYNTCLMNVMGLPQEKA